MPIIKNGLVIDKGKRLKHVNGQLKKNHPFMAERWLTKKKNLWGYSGNEYLRVGRILCSLGYPWGST
jgi:hypothetical protein